LREGTVQAGASPMVKDVEAEAAQPSKPRG
jgi:hypothetical protein